MTPDEITVNLLNGNDALNFSVGEENVAEEICFKATKICQIGSVARHLFALRRPDGTWVSPGSNFQEERKGPYELRMRFQVPDVGHLRSVDAMALDYFFYQIRQDFLNGLIPETLKSQEKILGLAVTDMYRVSLEKNLTREMLEKDYKKYLPRSTIKNALVAHLGVKKAMHNALLNLGNGIKDPAYIKVQYVNQLIDLAPGYGCEEYDVFVEQDGAIMEVKVCFEPFNKETCGLWMRTKSKRKVESHHLCNIGDLCFISMRNDNTVEISRKNGVPLYFKFNSTLKMLSFIGVLDGYYRLMEKWTFNLCNDFLTPFIHSLRAMKCHGPVGRAFAYNKLSTKRHNEPGCYILRQGWMYGTYRLDICTESGTDPRTLVILETANGFKFDSRPECFTTINELLAFYNEQCDGARLKECIPPSEYDDSPLLLCKIRGKEAAEGGCETGFSSPHCIDIRQVKLVKILDKSGRFTSVIRGVWNRRCPSEQLPVAVKILKKCKPDHSKIEEFLQMANNCIFWDCENIVTFYGVILTNPLALVMEYLPLGSLDVYLDNNRAQIQEVDLVEAAVYLGKALWYLEEQGIVHGNICCKCLLMASHDETSFKIKLADPGMAVHKIRVHWIPPECYDNLSSTSTRLAADVWAFGTTLWEIFSFGQVPLAGTSSVEEVTAFYKRGGRLPIPDNCDSEIYKLMKECWCRDPDARIKPQAIVRDINHIFYDVYNSRRVHSYAMVETKSFISSLSSSCSSLNMNNQPTTPMSVCMNERLIEPRRRPVSNEICDDQAVECQTNSDVLDQLSQLSLSPSNISLDSMIQDEPAMWVIEMSQLKMMNRLGQGFYGEVYQALLTRWAGLEQEAVAVKQLRTTSGLAGHQDLLREISIMKSLQHKNIVEIKGVVEDPKTLLVMEFVPLGSMLVYINTHKERLCEKLLLKFSSDIAEGMEYLDQKRIVHRDLAARNILVATEDTVKISDFGLAQKVGMKDYYKLKTNRDLPVRWYAPETIRTWKFTSKSDVWSFGITLWEMFSYGKEPIIEGCKDDELLKALEEGKRLSFPNTCSLRIYTHLMLRCWEAEPENRHSFTQLLGEIKDLYNNV